LTFSEDHISTSRGRCALKFLHALENDQGFLAHTPSVTEVSLTYFYNGGVKNWLKIQRIRAHNFGVKLGIDARKLCHMASIRWALWLINNFWGHCTLKTWDNKNIQHLARFRTTFEFHHHRHHLFASKA